MMGLSLSVVNPTTLPLRAAGVDFAIASGRGPRGAGHATLCCQLRKCAGEMTDGDRRRCTCVES
jgi:hypothetical protein